MLQLKVGLDPKRLLISQNLRCTKPNAIHHQCIAAYKGLGEPCVLPTGDVQDPWDPGEQLLIRAGPIELAEQTVCLDIRQFALSLSLHWDLLGSCSQRRSLLMYWYPNKVWRQLHMSEWLILLQFKNYFPLCSEASVIFKARAAQNVSRVGEALNAESLVMIMITVFSSCRWHFIFQELGETLINGQRASQLAKLSKAISERDFKQIATLCFMHNWVGKAFLNVND